MRRQPARLGCGRWIGLEPSRCSANIAFRTKKFFQGRRAQLWTRPMRRGSPNSQNARATRRCCSRPEAEAGAEAEIVLLRLELQSLEQSTVQNKPIAVAKYFLESAQQVVCRVQEAQELTATDVSIGRHDGERVLESHLRVDEVAQAVLGKVEHLENGPKIRLPPRRIRLAAMRM